MNIEELVNMTSLPEEKIKSLQNLDKIIYEEEHGLESEEIARVQNLLADVIGDMSMNDALRPIAPYGRPDTGIGAIPASILKDMTFRARHLEKISPVMDTLWTNFNRVNETGAVLDDNEKITLEQFGIMHDLAMLNRSLEGLDKKGLISGNEKLEELYEQSKKAAIMMKYFDDTFDATFRSPTGAIVFDKTAYKSKIYGKALSFFEKVIAFFITKYGHASTAVVAKDENIVSHINPGYKEEKFSLRNFLYSDTYQIRIENLIDSETKELLQEKLGENWLQVIEQKYAQIERDIHDGAMSKHNHVQADGSTSRFAQIATVFFQGGHKNFVMKDHSNEEIRDQVFGRGKWAENQPTREMLCSEFTGMTAIAAIQELNDVVKQELSDRGAEDIPDTIIQSPISEKEKLHLLTPERLLTAMQERGAVMKVESPSEINAHLSQKSTGSSQQLAEKMREIRESTNKQWVEGDEPTSPTVGT